MQLLGRPVSPGFARGYAYILDAQKPTVPRYRIADAAVGDECRRLEAALLLGAEDLARVRARVSAELRHAETEIFDAHLALLNDRELMPCIGDHIARERVNAEWAVEATARRLVTALASADNEYLREERRIWRTFRAGSCAI